MSMKDLTGKVQTVLGLIPPGELGMTLPHEHLQVDLSVWYVEPVTAKEKTIAHQPVSLENVGWLHYNATKNLDNVKCWGEDVAIKEALLFKEAGGSAIVDLSVTGMGRNPLALKRIAQMTGLNIIMGCGYYIEPSQPPELARKTEEEIAEEIIRDITVGADNTGVKAGIIGEIGCSYPLMAGERKVLRAAAIAQKRTGAAINVHPGYPSETSPLEIIEVLAEAGASIQRTVISHIDYISTDAKRVSRYLQYGCYIEYDQFGHLGSILHPTGIIDIPSEGQRILVIKELIEQGYLNKILISHDICTKMRLTRYGGVGYAHILEHVVPLMQSKGISEQNVHTIILENPRQLLQFV